MATTRKPEGEFFTYRLLQAVPCLGFVAVFAEPCADDEGKYQLVAHPIHTLGVAEVTMHESCGVRGTEAFRMYEDRCPNELVGLILEDGDFTIANEFENFAGLALEGQDISSITAHLDFEIVDRLKK